MRKFWDKIKK